MANVLKRFFYVVISFFYFLTAWFFIQEAKKDYHVAYIPALIAALAALLMLSFVWRD